VALFAKSAMFAAERRLEGSSNPAGLSRLVGSAHGAIMDVMSYRD